MKRNINYLKGSNDPLRNYKYAPKGISAIYILKSDTDGSYYIGRSKDVGRRLTHHFGSLRRNKHTNQLLQDVYNKVGEDDFSFYYEECPENELITSELNILKKHASNDKCVNMVDGSNSWVLNPKLKNKVDKFKIKVSNSAKKRVGELNPFYGKKHSDKTKEILREKSTSRVNKVQRDPIIINGILYDSMTIASEITGVHITTISFRVNSKKEIFKNWYKYDGVSDIYFDENFYFPLDIKKITNIYEIEGVRYYSTTEIASYYNIGISLVSYRLNSNKFTEWIRLV